ncbi:MAG: amino acid adenylation domain-containing protein, partial [Rhodocyclaceae bacterium]
MRTCFVFSGIGTQWQGMGLALGEDFPGFEKTLAQIDACFEPLAGWSLRTLLDGSGAHDLDKPAAAHAAIFAIQAGLSAVLREAGVQPDMIIGHSGGEVAAALAAGVLSLEDAVRLVVAHGEVMDSATLGAMLHVNAPRERVEAVLGASGLGTAAAIVVDNAHNSVVVAGSDEAVERLSAYLARRGMDSRKLRIRLPFHTPAVAPGLPRFRERLAGLQPRAAHTPIYSALQGDLAGADDFDADYWVRHISRPVRFHEAAQALLASGVSHCVELSPHPALLQHMATIAGGASLVGLATLHRDEGAAPLRDCLELLAPPPGQSDPTREGTAVPGTHSVATPETTAHATTSPAPAAAHRAPPEDTVDDRAGKEPADDPRIDIALSATHPVASQTAILAHVHDTLVAVADGQPLPPDWVDATWSELGLSSAQLVAFAQRLAATLDRPLPATLAYRCPTPVLLAAHLARATSAPGGEARAAAESTTAATATAAPGRPEEAATRDAVVVTGMACRFPGGANTPQAYWELLVSDVDPISEIPVERWRAQDWFAPAPAPPGKTHSRWGGFIRDHDLTTLDDKLFRLTPREASALDPQQRLLLEVCWEALENAGIAPLSLKGRRVAVYLGMATDDYKSATLYGADPGAIDPYSAAGAMASTAGGRLSYYFGWRGANVTIDTACSSSLVALHLARRALEDDECDLALVAGVNILLTPHLYVYFSQVGALSPTGRCHTFDAAADGYVRGEGCGVLVLERERDARRALRTPRARIAGTAVNQDGASTGFSAPNGEAQTEVITAAWRAAGATAKDIDYVEAHGTGTPVGDPIELESLAEALGSRSPDDPLRVGSVKSVIGHLEASAGIAGVIKLVLALEHGQLPANRHFQTPNPRLDWARLPLAIVDRVQPWPRRGARRLAGISSFGFSGTNAHAVIEGMPAEHRATEHASEPVPSGLVAVLSAPSETALHALAARTATALGALVPTTARAAAQPGTGNLPNRGDECHALDPRLHIRQLLWSSNTGRQGFSRRVAFAASDASALAARMRAWAKDGPTTINADDARSSSPEHAPGAIDRTTSAASVPAASFGHIAEGEGRARRLVFAFTGQGCQYPGMAAGLYHAEPVFRAVIDTCDSLFTTLRGVPLRPYLLDPTSDPRHYDAIELAQPAVFMVQCALTALWAHWGIRPDCVIGHSAGEVAAGVAAGVLTLEEGLRLIEARARLMGEHPPGGRMVAVPSDEPRARSAIAASGCDDVFVAGINGTDNLVLSGDGAQIERVVAQLGVPAGQVRALRISNAFHTPRLAPLAEQLRAHRDAIQTAASDHTGTPRCSWISSMDGRDLADAAAPGAPGAYWAEQLMQPVRFDAALTVIEARGPATFVEIGPAAVLAALGQERSATLAGEARWIASQQRQVDARSALFAALAALASEGHAVDWRAQLGLHAPRRVDLPPYPFQRRRHWRMTAPTHPDACPTDACVAAHAPPPSVAPAPHALEETAPMPVSPDLTPARDAVRALIAEITGFAPADLDDDVALLDLGLDSLMLMQLKGHLQNRHGLALKIAEFYEGVETIDKIAARMPAMALSAPASAPASGTSTTHGDGAAAPIDGTAASAPGTPPAPMALPQSAFSAASPSASGALPAGAEGLMALQLQTLSRLMSEQLAALGNRAPQAATSPAAGTPAAPATPDAAASTPPSASTALPAAGVASHAAATPPKAPNFRSLTLEPDRLDAGQQAFVADLTRRYVARTPGSRALAERYRGPLADWKNTLSYRHSLKELTYPIAAEKSQGAWFTDVDGNAFLDITMGCGITLLGHNPKCVHDAVREQLERHYAIGPQTPLAGEVAELFCRVTGMERVTFCNTGAEAVMMAVRTARAVTGRKTIAIFAGAYHGTWDGVLGVEHEGQVWPIADGIPQGMVDDLLILNYGTDEALTTLRERAHELAAVLVEPVQSRRPGLQPAAFLRALREITAAADTALIFDEMITGFRIAPGGAQAHFGIRADLATYGKIAGGGLPLSAVAGSARFMDRVDGGPWRYGDDSAPRGDVIYFGGTYVKHPLALAAAKAALSELERRGQDAYDTLNRRTARLAGELNDWFEDNAVPLSMSHFGSLFRIDGSGRYSAMMQPIELDLFFFLLLLRGLYVWERRVLFLSFAHDETDIELIVAAVKEAVAELRAGGFEFRTPGAQRHPKPDEDGIIAAAPASSAQRRLFALEQLEGRNTVYNVPLALDLHGPLDLAHLRACFARLLRRHESLRTRFRLVGDEVEQQVLSSDAIALPFEVRECTEDLLAPTAETCITPFDPGEAPLFRVCVLRASPRRHVVLMDAHHIVVDGLSLNNLASDLMRLYAGETLSALQVRPLDAIAAQARYLDSEQAREDAAWWRARFATLPPPLALPLEHPRPERRNHRGDDVFATLDGATTGRLKHAARSRRLTLFALALGVYGGLLHRLTGQHDLVVGVPVSGRDDPRFMPVVGMFANTLALRLAAAPERALGEHARDCQQAFLEALEHEAWPLETLIAGLRLPRDLARNPLFDTMFIYEDGSDRVYRFPGLECHPLSVSRHAAMFDLAMEVIDTGDQLELRLEYDTQLFSRTGAEHILSFYRHLLEHAAERLDTPLAELDCVPRAQHERLLSWGDGGPLPEAAATATTVPALLARAHDAHPTRPALIAGQVRLDYRQLHAAAARMAPRLQATLATAAGAAQPRFTQPRIALVCERSAALVVGLLAIVRAGAAYVPVDPDFPPERIALMLEDSGCVAALISPTLRQRITLPPGVLAIDAVLDADNASSAAADVSALPQLRPPSPDDLAYLIYTSGSTGRPKGVRLFQRNAAGFFATLAPSFGFAPGQRLLALTTVSFDIAALELLGALAHGMTVVLADAVQARDPERIVALIEAHAIDVLQTTPTRLRMILEAPGGERALARLSTLLVGGEALPRDLAARLARLAKTTVYNVYGPTETTIWSAASIVRDDAPTLGRPLPGERIFVLSPALRPQPPGAPGEIAIAGAGVGGAYHERPELSAERFILRPELAEGPIYLTGDLGRWDQHGNLHYLGRNDDQIKIRGMRIEAGEVEQALRALPDIRDAVVLARPGRDGIHELVAWVVCPDLPPLVPLTPQTVPLWRAELARHLPEACIPAHFVRVEALPQTPNGKIDRRALPEHEAPHPSGAQPPDTTARAPDGPRERAIVDVFNDVLGTQLGPDDDYFAHGGDSIRAMR